MQYQQFNNKDNHKRYNYILQIYSVHYFIGMHVGKYERRKVIMNYSDSASVLLYFTGKTKL